MNKTKLSSKGQVIIPKSSRDVHHWEEGQELMVIDTDEGVLLKPVKAFPSAKLDELVGCLRYSSTAKTIEEMEQAICQGAKQVRDDTVQAEKARLLFEKETIYITKKFMNSPE